VSYRKFKHLLGETSLERKCRFIFGGGILALVTLSFNWYGQKTESLVIGQKTEAARVLVGPIVANKHLEGSLLQGGRELLDELSSEDSASFNLQTGYKSQIFAAFKPPDNSEPAPDEFEAEMFKRFMQAAAKPAPPRPEGSPEPQRKPMTFPNNSPTYGWRIKPGKREYQYAEAVLFKPTCLTGSCHGTRRASLDGQYAFTKPYDLAGVVTVTLPMEQTNKDIHRNRAILISTALVTAILAMIASYVIVRYVIVKPVKHLRDVSDAIATGKLNIRSQIHTGDEFEELSHAFNRMLHNLVAMQQELRDVNTDLDKKVDELAQANMALFEMNRIKSDFLATMSHELRTPLNSIIGFSEVLASSDALTDRQKRYAGNILHSGKMLLGLINDILDLAKIESGKMEVRVEDFSIRDVCEALTNQMRPLADKKNLDLRCDLGEAIPLLRQDPGKIRQIIYNLLSNAIKFTPDSGRVVLSARTEGKHVVLSVTDTGVGIAEEDRESIFEKFRQAGMNGMASNVLTREHEGTGLGLSIVRELTRLLGGDLMLESELGKGSTFTVRLPMQMTGHRQIVVNIADQAVDLTKARRVENRTAPVPLTVAPGAHDFSNRPKHPSGGNGANS
jgi:signal transduction histidine kinase